MKYIVPNEVRARRGNIKYLDDLREISRRNRNKATRGEDRMWYEILNKRIEGYKFLRQKPIGRFVADFYCSILLMVVEVDGGWHIDRKNYDLERDRYLNLLNIITIRYGNGDVLNKLEWVREDLTRRIKERVKEPPFSREGDPKGGGFWGQGTN